MQQGELDGLCGLYAIINATRALCPELDDFAVRTLFWRLAEAMNEDRSGTAVCDALCWGMEVGKLRRLLRVAHRQVAQEIGVRLAERPLQKKGAKWTLPTLWRALGEVLHDGGIAIVGLSGADEHWTVVGRITDRTIRLLDSDRRKLLQRSRCGMTSRARHQLRSADIIVDKRIG